VHEVLPVENASQGTARVSIGGWYHRAR
jgi:Rps23 Pro-64 3,4-dihydroxylase Tpa1-like proline 4-hydroxylase